MSDWKGIVKKGWHPEKDGTTFKGQVSGLLGRGGDSSSSRSESYVARPVSELRDPSSFGPPPKRKPNLAPPPSSTPSPQPQHYDHEQAGVTDAGAPPAPAPKPWQLDTTGLDTSHLPPPPGRRDGADGRAPPPPPPYSARATPSAAAAAPPPALPPRLPPRSSNTSSPVQPPSQPPQQQQQQQQQQSGLLNQNAVSRLGAAGISVPGFGIGSGKSVAPPPPPPAPRSSTPAAATTTAPPSQMNELQSRFARFGKSSSSSSSATTTTPTTAAPKPQSSEGTTWSQKQAALRTASNFHKDPSSVSFADARSAAGTANNFRQRHGEQVASGMQTANKLGQRFGVTESASSASNAGAEGGTPHAGATGLGAAAAALAKKKPAPPPPPKKPDLSGSEPPPPPVPLATRPRF